MGIAAVVDEFISVWIGADWVLAPPFSILLGIELFFLCMEYFLSKYRNAIGLFQQVQLLPIVGAVLNIVLSIILVKYMDVSGVILGTIMAEAGVFMVLNPVVIYKYGFKGQFSIRTFYLQFITEIVIISVTYIAARFLCNHVVVGRGWLSVVVHIVICGCMTPLVMLLANIRKEETKYLLRVAKSKLTHKHKKS